MLEYGQWLNNQIRVYDGLAWANFGKDGELISKSNSAFCGILTDAQIVEAMETIKHFEPAPFAGDVYLRFNNLPECGKSKNYATGETENGVSCYALTWDLISGSYKRCGSGFDGAMIAYAIQGAPIYFITGIECGTGSDGEPLLSKPKVLADAQYDASKDGYVVRVM